jgi:RNA polymerase sigma-70 factor (family 1)
MITAANELRIPELLTRLKQGDRSAFAEIYNIYSRELYLKILRMAKDKDVTDDIIQELFIKVWEHRDTIDLTKSFLSYLHVIAQNLLYNHFRKLNTYDKLLASLTDGSYAHFNQDVEAQVEHKESVELMKNAIDRLSPQRKMAFTLCKIEGRSYKEVSEIMGISAATINSHITQSVQQIREYMLKHRDVHLLAIAVYTAMLTIKTPV